MVVMKFDGRSQTWHLLHTEPLTDTISHCATAVVGTIIYFFDTVDNVITFDTVTEVWRKLPEMPMMSFTKCSSVSVCNGLIYIVGPYGLTCFDPRSEFL
jgi:N-acetylneuraminic acid mutarotase